MPRSARRGESKQRTATVERAEQAAAANFVKALERVAKADKEADEGSAMVAKAMRSGPLKDPDRMNLLLQRLRSEQETARFALSVAQQAYAEAQSSRREICVARQQTQMTSATWVLAVSTIVLAISTIGLFVATLNMVP